MSVFLSILVASTESLGCSAMEDDSEGVDLSRLPSKSYLFHEGALDATRKEIWGLISLPNLNGNLQESPLQIVSANDPATARYPKYFTLAVRKRDWCHESEALPQGRQDINRSK